MASKLKKKFNETVEAMKKLETYREEFNPTIERYSQLSLDYAGIYKQWKDNGCKITEPYTNKGGNTNPRKTGEYQSLETLRKELLELENVLGLTPKGYKNILNKVEPQVEKQPSSLSLFLNGLSIPGGNDGENNR